jgi:hypothetical protein
MANTVIQLKHSTLTGNVPSSLANGEISINSRDGKFFYSTPAGVVTTHYPYLGPAGLNKEIQFNDSGTLGANAGLSFDKSSGIFSTKLISVTNSTGDEGGEILLAKPSTNTTLVGTGITIDAFQNKIRFFEQGGTARGAYIDLTECSGGAGTNLLAPSSSTDGFARTQANAAFIQANASFLQANTPSNVANSAASYANSAFLRANTPSATANSAALYANAAFTRANNSLDANNGGTVTGTITATSFITTGSFGNILGANTIYANNFVANTGFIQFADGSKQYTANAGSGGSGTTDFGFGQIFTPNNSVYANATSANDKVSFTGESGVYVFANSTTKTITVAGTPGAQGMTVDYGYVSEAVFYSVDYGTL